MTPHDQPFSRRFGHRPAAAEITVREDAPNLLRGGIIMIVDALGYLPGFSRSVVCRVLMKKPDRTNWSEYPNIFDEVQSLMEAAPWFRVYDVAEAFYATILDQEFDKAPIFQESLNDIFVENGIGWAMEHGRIVVRGSEGFTLATKEASTAMAATGRRTAANELHEALADISRRPDADVTGAIQHAMAALECVARDVTGHTGKTLGQLVADLRLPKPLDVALEKLWGYTSETGRHLREGGQPSFDEAELVVTLACGISTYLSRRR